MQDKNQIPFIGKLHSVCRSDAIRNRYYALVDQPKNISEISRNYVGKINHYNKPFYIKVNEAYLFSPIWNQLQFERNYVNEMKAKKKLSKNDKLYLEYNGIYAEEEKVKAALLDYSDGFCEGYIGFDQFISSGPLNDPDSVKRRIVRYATSASYFDDLGGLPITVGAEISLQWREPGIKWGRFYRAWYLILENCSSFEKFFEDPQQNPKLPNRLSDIFTSRENYESAMNALKNSSLKPDPLIDDNYNYLKSKNEKAGFAAWIDVLKSRGMIKSITSELMASILSNEIKGLSINEKTLRDSGKTFYKKYLTKFSAIL